MQNTPNIVTVLGSTHNAVEVIFRKVFEHNTCPGTILVLDYMGRGAAVLSWSNKMSMLKKTVHWFDINDRRHTLQLLEIGNTPHSKEILERIIHLFIQITNVFISPTTIEWTVNTAIKFSENGYLHLTTLIKLLTEQEIKKLYLDSFPQTNRRASINQEEIIALQKLLTWVLRFPSVYSICEGVNLIRLENYFFKKTVVWIESIYEHLERSEHHLLSGLVDIIAENAIKNFCYNNPKSRLDFTVLHVYPPQKPFLEFPEWIKNFGYPCLWHKTGNDNNTINIRHISIHNFLPQEPLKKNVMDWINATENVWIVGRIEKLKRELHKSWLTEAEMDLIGNLEKGKVWVRSNRTGKAIIANIRMGEEPLYISYQLRVQSNQKRKSTSVLQMSTEVDYLENKRNGLVGLYKKLYDIDFLQQGWFRVKEGKKDSHGIDKVTIKEYGENLDRELSELQYELNHKKYKCRPLRRIYIEKPKGGIRDLGVACVRDRVVQTSCLILLEAFRSPFADRIVVSMFGRGFYPEINNVGLLKTRSKKLLVKSFSKRWHTKIKWHSFNLSAAQILEFQANSLSKLLTHEGKYFPYRMKW